MDVPDFRTVTVEALAALVRDRTLTAAAVTEHALERIEALNPTLNAFVAVDADDARTQAAAIDERLDAGEEVGPLAGIPIGVKDLVDATGFHTSKGAMYTRHDPPATSDCTEVARMRAAGCVIVGKTNTPEHGCMGDTYNPRFGPTLNPWNPERSPGGSSGGTGSAIAAGMVPVGSGSDGGGSIRIPSAICGLSGIKTSQGRVPSGPPPSGLIDLSCVGPMARLIRDVALCLDAMVGPDPADLRSLPKPEVSWRAALDSPRVPARVLWAPSIDGEPVDAEIAA
ncbi:MAG: amidase, partial [Acidimicrobiaceae bacterium]|nr:amidase [Acidimicrobiaceae bacterium]